MLSGIFWLSATLNIALSIGLNVWIYALRRRNKAGVRLEATRGQYQDIWLSTAIVWTVLLDPGWPDRWFLYLAGAAALQWLAVRTLRRVRSL